MNTVENNSNETRKKFVGFRVPVKQYISIVQSADKLGISITDFVLSKIFSLANVENNTVKHLEITNDKQPLNNDSSITINKENDKLIKFTQSIDTKQEKLFSDENEKLLQLL